MHMHACIHSIHSFVLTKRPLAALGHIQKHAVRHILLSARSGKTEDVSPLQPGRFRLRPGNYRVDNRRGRVVGALFDSDTQRTLIGQDDRNDFTGFRSSQRKAGPGHVVGVFVVGLCDLFDVFANVGEGIVVVVFLVVVEDIVEESHDAMCM